MRSRFYCVNCGGRLATNMCVICVDCEDQAERVVDSWINNAVIRGACLVDAQSTHLAGNWEYQG